MNTPVQEPAATTPAENANVTDKSFLNDKKKAYSKEKQMAIFHYTLRNAKKLTAQNGLTLEENFAAIEKQRVAKAAAAEARTSG